MEIKLLHGDCLELMKDIPDGSIDMILCDLPYGITANEWDEVIPFEPLWEQYERIIKDNGAIVLSASQPFTTKLIMSNQKMYRYNWYWVKERATGFQFSGKQPMRKVEDVVVFYKKQPKYDKQGEKLEKPYKHVLPITKSPSSPFNSKNINPDGSRVYKWYTHSTKHNVIELSRDNTQKGVHSTQKPVALLEYLIKTYTNEGEVVLDNCMGSGSTGVACVNTNRNFIGIELDDKYFEIAKRRISEAQNKSEQITLFDISEIER
jgi:site-specific DNA-methyltransferase (adenine-specific)